MPLYEYHCPHCDVTFSHLRPFSRADAPAPCPECGGEDTRRALSLCASMSKSADGEARAVAGGGSCAGCGSRSCGTCRRN